MSTVKTSDRPAPTSQVSSGGSGTVADRLGAQKAKAAPAKQVRLKLVYVDFWSAVKFSFLIAAAVGIIIFVAVLLVWTVLLGTGVFTQLSELLSDVSGSKTSITSTLSFATVMGYTLVIAALNVVVGTVLGAIACVLYNLSVKVTGGVLVGFTNQ